MNVPLDDQYLTWLYSQIASVKTRNASKTYWTLAKQLYSKEFVWIVPNDDNRVEDGRDLRYEFIDAAELEDVSQSWIELGCSMLEMLIALSRVLAFQLDREPRDCFWLLMDHLDLTQYTDREYTDKTYEVVDNILDKVIWRTYYPNGRGGLFPLDRPHQDQRQVEIWYQLNAWLIEKGA